MYFFKPCLLTLLTLFSLFSLASQAPIKFQQLSVEQGLSQSTVYSIAQDKQEFIWLATQEGLNRYDGYEFKHYRNDLARKDSIPNNLVRLVFVDSNNVMWVGTQNGLSKYLRETDNFKNYFNETDNYQTLKDNIIWSIYEDNNNNIWVATASGLHQYDKQKDIFKRFNFKEKNSDLREIKSIFQDHNENIWLGTFENGLFLMNNSGTFITPMNGFNKWGLNIKAKTFFQIKELDNNYWFATEQGLFVVDEKYNLVKTISNTLVNNESANRIRTFQSINEQSIWLGTEAGLFELDLVTDIITQKRISSDNNTLSSSIIFTMLEDQSNSFWLGSGYNGSYRYNSTSSLFDHHLAKSTTNQKYVVSFTEYPEGDVWIATESDGLFKFNTKTTNIEKFETSLNIRISSIFAGDNNFLWVISRTNELYQVDKLTGDYLQHVNWLEKYHENPGRIDFIYADKQFWFGGKNGKLYNYNTETFVLENYKLQGNNLTLDIFALSFNKNKEIWTYTSSHELYLFNKIERSFRKVEIPHNNIFEAKTLAHIKETKRHIWFGFLDQGVLLLDKVTKVFSQFNEKTSLENNFIAGLVIDETGKGWVSTNKGISSINPDTGTVQNFGLNQGIQAEDFFAYSYLQSSDNRLFFGGVNGFNSFYPIDIRHDTEMITPPLNLNLLIANKLVNVGSNESVTNDQKKFQLKNQLFLTKELTLKYHQTPFTIEFASPNSTFSNEIEYRYMLEGLDENWIYTNAENRRATYSKLPHGDYKFKLESFSSKSKVYYPAKSIRLNILPPWWLTNTAWAMYLLACFFVVYYFYKQAKSKELSNIKVKESEERLKLALWGSGDEMWDWNLQTNKMYRSNIWGVLDFPKDSVDEDGEQRRNIHPQDYPRVKQLLKAHREGMSDHYEAAYRVKDKHKNWLWVLDRGKIVEHNENGEPVRMTGTLKDISQIKANEESLKLFAKCIENISDAVVVYDNHFLLVDCNISYQTITGQSRSQALGLELAFNSYPESFLQNLKKNLLTHGTWQGEVESKRSNNESYLIDITMDIIRDENDKISHFVGVFSDITKRKETEAELRKLANSDTLTGLPNRSYFQANQSQLVGQDTKHALLVFDLDNFKKINDSLGHQIGDVLLCKVTERIATVGNIKDTCYRLGGDEFALILEGNDDIHSITSIADEILNTIVEPYQIRNQEISLSCSIGIALFPGDGDNSHELLKNADTAMYHAKDKGGDTYQFFNDSMNKQAVKRLQIENLIRHGLKEDLFSVFYQPKIDIKSGKIKGMEALVRFEAGSKGIIRPDIFIPISEETGQIIEIGEIVLKKACLATKAWLDNGMFKGRIAVNLSAVQFRQPNLVQIIEEILEETKLPAHHLELEITEGTVMNSPQEAIQTMDQIRKLGINLSLDDFGTGYSSLAYLKQFPLNTLKIDKAFVDDIESSEEGRNMVATIITIAHNLGMDVVAEGVETDSQLQYLKTLNCEQMQGYLYSRPLSEEDFSRYLLSHIITNQSTPYQNI